MIALIKSATTRRFSFFEFSADGVLTGRRCVAKHAHDLLLRQQPAIAQRKQERLADRNSQPSVFIVEVRGGAECLVDRHIGFLCPDPVSENGDVTTPRHAPFGHGDGMPAGSFAKMGPDLVSLETPGG